VVDDETGSDIFLHITNFKGVPKEGDKVTFEVKKDKKGLHAFNVVKA
jgi:CspA family cold shock protein